MNRFISAFLLLTVVFAGSSVASAKEDSNRLLTGAAVGAGTNVIGGAVLDNLDGTAQQQPQYVQVQGPDGNWYWQQVGPAPEDPNKVILKRALQGAITGAVAAEVAGGDDKESGGKKSGSGIGNLIDDALKNSHDNDDQDDDKHKKYKYKDGHRPPGWDRGRKEGWDGGDIPPGLRDKND